MTVHGHGHDIFGRVAGWFRAPCHPTDLSTATNAGPEVSLSPGRAERPAIEEIRAPFGLKVRQVLEQQSEGYVKCSWQVGQ